MVILILFFPHASLCPHGVRFIPRVGIRTGTELKYCFKISKEIFCYILLCYSANTYILKK